MLRNTLILLVVLVLFAPRCYPQDISNDDRLRAIVNQDRQAEVTIPYTDKKTLDYITRKVSILSVRNKTVFISLSPVTVEWFIQQKFDYTIKEKSLTKGIITASNMEKALGWNEYPTYMQYDSIMQNFKALYPSLCQLDTIGISNNGKMVFALKISDNVSVNEDEPEVFYSSSIHGDETGGFVMMLRFADYLLKNYNLDKRVKNLVDNLEIWINPLANPDGTYGTGNTISSPVRYNAKGYDLNRNFPDPVTPDVVMQKETLDMVNFMEKHRFVLSANFHAGNEVVNYPWDRWYSKYHADDLWFNSISRTYADTVHFYAGSAYMNDFNNGITRGSEWYVIYGGRQDFVTYGLQGREVTIELDVTKQTPAAQLELLWQNNYHSMIGYLENALYGIHGQVINANTSLPVPAKIFIAGHDTDSSHVYSDTVSGKFVRMLSPGSWNLTFTAKGYKDTTVNSINVFAWQKTDLVIEMSQSTDWVDSTVPSVTSLYPNPAAHELRVTLTDGMSGITNVRVISMTGIVVLDFNTEVVQGEPFPIDIEKLNCGIYSIVFTNISIKKFCKGRFIVIK
ncbi:MAG TPA: M14 family zinc carboxypeptidase [Bacteroidales bacterium]|nr:M14 family zinc carboxypeptidase [Bacteroidales bacterium]